MTMQKSCPNSQLQRQQQYVRPDSPPPSAVKKSPLAMLVETCSSIGQELSKTSKPADVATQLETRKARISSSPNSASSKPNSPSYSQPQQKAMSNSILSTSRQAENSSVQNGNQMTAAALASQYQLMCQQFMYQTEFLKNRNKDFSVTPPAAAKTLHETQLKPSCSMCSLSPGYVKGQCIHENPLTLSQMLAMLNSGSAATMLAYSSKLASLNQPLLNPSLPASGYPSPSLKNWEASRLSPPSAHSVDNRRTSANSSASTGSPRNRTSPAPNNHSSEQPMDLQVQKSKSPVDTSVRLIECHWVGAEGYCGKRFHSQDDMMKHLKIHVITCPNVITDEDNNSRIHQNKSRQRSRSPPPSDNASYKQHSSSKGISSYLNKRFHPYSLTENSFPNVLLTPR